MQISSTSWMAATKIMREPKSKIIDSNEYTVSMLPARSAYAMYADIVKMVGPAMASSVANQGASDGTVLDADVASLLTKVVGHMTGLLEVPKVMAIIDKLSAVSLVNGMPLHKVLDEHFAGDFIGLNKWLLFALEANFGNFSDFLPDLVARGSAILKEQGSKSQSTSQKSGPYGA